MIFSVLARRRRKKSVFRASRTIFLCFLVIFSKKSRKCLNIFSSWPKIFSAKCWFLNIVHYNSIYKSHNVVIQFKNVFIQVFMHRIQIKIFVLCYIITLWDIWFFEVGNLCLNNIFFCLAKEVLEYTNTHTKMMDQNILSLYYCLSYDQPNR